MTLTDEEKNISYHCKVCGHEVDPEQVEIVNVSEYGVIYKCGNCSGANAWGFVAKR